MKESLNIKMNNNFILEGYYIIDNELHINTMDSNILFTEH